MNPITKSICMPGFEAWWRNLTRKGDPIRRPYLIEESFMAGYEYAKRQVFEDLAEEFQRRARSEQQ